MDNEEENKENDEKSRSKPTMEKSSRGNKPNKNSKGKNRSVPNLYQTPKPHSGSAWNDGKKSVDIVSNGIESEGKKPHFNRIRTQFDMKQTSLGHLAHQIETKRVMEGFARVLKKVEEDASIARWDGDNKVCKEFESLSPSEVSNYVDVPPWAKRA